MQYIEIEVRIYLEKDVLIETWLNDNAKYKGQERQVDKYYQHPKMPFLKSSENGLVDSDHWLRVRRGKKGCELCYKHWHRDQATKESLYADEVETIVESQEAIEKLLELLGYENISTIDKVRDSWVYNDFKFERDSVLNLGKFYEIEFCGEIGNPAEGKKYIFDLLERIGLKEWIVIDRGYPWMQWNGVKS